MLDCLHSYNTRSVSNNNLFMVAFFREYCLLGAGMGLGLAGAFITWQVSPIDMDSNIEYYVMFVFLFQEIVSKAKA